MTIDSEFKKALQQLSDAEKDKLILRLLKHDVNLVNRLRFELIDTETVEQKRKKLEVEIESRVKLATQQFNTPGWLLMDIRYLSGDINQHVAITKDKYGDIMLNCYMLKLVLEQNNGRIIDETYDKAYTFCIYIIAKLFKILLLIQKQHEDLHIEFSNNIEAIGTLLGENPHLMKTAINNGLDVNWLIRFNIPKNIAVIHKDLKNKGFLK